MTEGLRDEEDNVRNRWPRQRREDRTQHSQWKAHSRHPAHGPEWGAVGIPLPAGVPVTPGPHDALGHGWVDSATGLKGQPPAAAESVGWTYPWRDNQASLPTQSLMGRSHWWPRGAEALQSLRWTWEGLRRLWIIFAILSSTCFCKYL